MNITILFGWVALAIVAIAWAIYHADLWLFIHRCRHESSRFPMFMARAVPGAETPKEENGEQ